ncbi:RND family transporter [Marinoscillum sp.]|uniref:efflux RND transporter permease subunit n=1 Tax=Marinoscillum sp. TaxID=2024838 RepID=UPI0038735689
MTAGIKQTEGVIQAASPLDFQQLIKAPIGVTSVPLIHLERPEMYTSDSIRIFAHPVYKTFFGENGRSLLIQVTHQHFADPALADRLVDSLNELLTQNHFDQYRMAGKLIAQKAFIGYIQNDFVLFLASALVLSFLLLALIFRSVKVSLMPYLISVSSLIWLLGLMAMLGQTISILGSLIPPVILFVSTSDAIHLINAFRSDEQGDFINRLKTAVHKVLAPTFLTSVTTAIGFVSLVTIDTEPIRFLGIFCGIGIMLSFIITFAFGPLLIHQSYPPRKPAIGTKFLAIWVIRHSKVIFIGATLLVILSGTGLYYLKTDARLLDDLPEGSEVRQDFTFVDDHYGGSKPWEMAYWPKNPEQDIWDEAVMREADKIHQYLLKEYPMERVWSPVTFAMYGQQMISGGGSETFEMPDTQNYYQAIRTIRPYTRKSEVPDLISREDHYARFAGFIPEFGSLETIRKDQKLLTYLHSHIDHDVIGYRLTGTTYLIDKSHELLSFNLMRGLLIAISVISLILGIYFRSLKILLISLIPNIIPLLATAGYMGLTGISLKLTTSIIFAVAFGIAVDDTIHFISVYRRQKARNRIYRMINTFQTAGKAMSITTLIIVSGFVLFLFSSFGATYYLGLFLSLSLTIALIIDLTLLPLLLHFTENKNSL